MRYSKFTGIIINRRLVKDADNFYTIITRDEGKLSVYARSVRSSKSKRVASLDLFNLINFGLVENHGNKTLTHVELVNSFHEGKRKLGNISRLFELGELVDALTEEQDPNEEVYDLLNKALTHIHQFESREYMYRFKLRLLEYLGFGPHDLTPDTVDSYIESLLNRSLRKIVL